MKTVVRIVLCPMRDICVTTCMGMGRYRATHNDKDVPDAMVRQWYSQDRNRDGSIQEKEFRFNE